ncbi:hypothetical protein [Schaalia suimastitidis]|uniref:hypothetical protein n=1 Tax=Schaalia suimastitidis TaxID=121163 RepID=UPI00041FCCF4|nr:hypothetical protein [Schaalia suimastitidis]
MTPDSMITFLSMDLFWLLAAFAGGAFGAMIGANYAFSFTGVMILTGLGVAAGTGSTMVLDYVAFGPAFGPHIAFAGGVAAAAYAAKKGPFPTGRDVSTPLAGLGQPAVLLVGALFGAFGYIFQKLVTLIPWFGANTDSVAFTVVTSAILARLLFGKTGVAHKLTKPNDQACWLRWQETPGQLLVVSASASFFAAGISAILVGYVAPASAQPDIVIGIAQTLPFAISALCIFFVAGGLKFPVTHHMTIIAALASVKFFLITENGLLAVLIGTLFGIISGFACEYFARLFNNHGDTHIDPPAGVIWFMTTAVLVTASAF